MTDNDFRSITEAARHFNDRFAEMGTRAREASGSNDDYKMGIRELTHTRYSFPLTAVNGGGAFKPAPIWAVNEFLSEMLNLNPPLMMRYNPKIMDELYKLEDNNTPMYTYSRRFQEWGLITKTVDILSERSDSKRAYIPVFMPYDVDPKKSDVPCLIGYDVKVREGRMNVGMFFRSHDFFTGFKYDGLFASFLTQNIAMMVNARTGESIKPGTLHCYDGSLHVYGRDEPKVQDTINAPPQDGPEFDIMHPYKDPKEVWADLLAVHEIEDRMFNDRHEGLEQLLAGIQNPAYRDFARIYINRNARQHGNAKLHYETRVLPW